MRTRWEIINFLICVEKYTSYLEIGLAGGNNFKKIKCAHKVSVDPGTNTNPTYQFPSDAFFNQNVDKFDIVFIDGLHTARQVRRDILNSLKVLNSGGTIVCHDMNPRNFVTQQVPRVTKEWYGTCWKAFVRLRAERDDLDMCTVDTDCGLGIIRKGSQKKLMINFPVSYARFNRNRKEWLNLISVKTFLDRYQ